MLTGFGAGLVNTPLASTAVGVVDHTRAGMASGINSTLRQVGTATGVAALGSPARNTGFAVGDRVEPGGYLACRGSAHAIAATHHERGRILGEAGGHAASSGIIPRHAAKAGFVSGLNEILLIAAILAFIGALLSFVLIRQRDFVDVAPRAADGRRSGAGRGRRTAGDRRRRLRATRRRRPRRAHPKISHMRLSVLDQSPISEGSTGADALRNTLDLARLADPLGYHRYWVAEHHGGAMLAGASPEVLIGPIAAATERDPGRQRRRDAPALQPAEGRRDLQPPRGLFARPDRPRRSAAPPAPTRMTVFALQRDRRQASPDDFPQQLAELLAYLEDGCRPITRSPGSRHLPGGRRPRSGCSAPRRRARSGRPSSGSPTRSPTSSTPTAREIAQLYREGFGRARLRAPPDVAVAVWALCAETDEQAQHLAASHR